MRNEEKLNELYHETSKHSNYQIVASVLEKYLDNADINVNSRYEKERLHYFLDNVDVKNKKILDIGGNTGYFTFELLENGASKASYYEGNTAHAQFVTEASKFLGIEDEITIHNEYFLFDDKGNETFDVIFLLNVLHHVGDDYGDTDISKQKALEQIAKSLQSMATQTDILVFQLGFNWMGDCKLPLFEHGTKREMIDFVQDAVKEHYTMTTIGIAEKEGNNIVYNSINDTNIERFDALGEFLNRPIFIMKSKC